MDPATPFAQTIKGMSDEHHASASPHPAFDEVAGDVALHDILHGFVERIESLDRGHRETLAGKIDFFESGIEVRERGHEALLRHHELVVSCSGLLGIALRFVELPIDLLDRRLQLRALGPQSIVRQAAESGPETQVPDRRPGSRPQSP